MSYHIPDYLISKHCIMFYIIVEKILIVLRTIIHSFPRNLCPIISFFVSTKQLLDRKVNAWAIKQSLSQVHMICSLSLCIQKWSNSCSTRPFLYKMWSLRHKAKSLMKCEHRNIKQTARWTKWGHKKEAFLVSFISPLISRWIVCGG